MKETIRALALGLGADVCGFAGADRFDGAPAGFRPQDILASCRTVIVVGVALPRGIAAVRPEILYNHANNLAQAEADRIALRLAAGLERTCGGVAVSLPGDSPYEYWDAPRKEGRGILSMKHAAVLAGIGTLGKSTLLLSRRFGTRIDLSAVLTDAVFETDPPSEPVCLPGCRLCLDRCPVGALDGMSANQKRCREHTYDTNARGFSIVRCNICRTGCPMAAGKD